MSEKQFEYYFTIPDKCLISKHTHNGCHYLRSGDEITACFKGSDLGDLFDEGHKCRLRIIGEIDVYPLYRQESAFPLLYRLIDDCLCSNTVHHSPFSLKFSSSGYEYPQAAYYKVISSGPAGPWYNLSGNDKKELRLGIYFKKDNLKYLSGGRICFVAEVYYKTDNRHLRDIKDPADKVYTIDIEEGTCDWKENFILIPTEEEIGCILVYITGEKFSGTVYLEDPALIGQGGLNFLPPFAPANVPKREFNWLGYNLSKKEWPKFEIKINGFKIFSGELFERIYRWPALEVEIPKGALRKHENLLSIKYISYYREVLPYKLKRIEFAGIADEDFNILACPRTVTAGEDFSILVSTGKPSIKAVIKSENENIVPIEKELILMNLGIHVIRFKSLCAGADIRISFETENNEYSSIVERIVVREEDNILTGTGDAIYINQNLSDMEYFLTWYHHYRIGNCITFRPVYKWSGSRILNTDTWKKIIRLCTEMRLFYCHMLDGRELPGCDANPGMGLMKGPYFIGFQSHEQDGAYYYQGSKSVEFENELYYDLWSRNADDGGICPTKCPVRTKSETFAFFDPDKALDMKDAALEFVQNVRNISMYASRHTGPSVLFKYFYQAGIEYLGAELMYGPQEVILSALRGASRAYGKKDFGAHLAVQWSTTPHNSRQRYRRYFLALNICYMHGVQHINTEEGLWRMEEGYADFERFSDPCIEHRNIQSNFLHFIKTHSRRGEMHVPFAFLHGQYDGWVCFQRGQVWAKSGKKWKFSRPEESWDLLKIFYPLSLLDAICGHPCPGYPHGFYSGTPYGPVDILPVEAPEEILKKYRLLAFLGWNTADPYQIEKLIMFVENGGTLLLGWPHLFTGTNRFAVIDDTPEILQDDYISRLIGIEFEEFIKTVDNNGNTIVVGKVGLIGANPLEVNADGIPMVLENRLGTGKVIFVNIKAYPAENYTKDIYIRLIEQMGDNIIQQEKERGWIKSSHDVEFTVYDNKISGLRTIYLLNIDWWNKGNDSSCISLLWGESSMELKIHKDCMNILTLSKNWAVWVFDNETDIMGISEKEECIEIKLQGYGETDVVIFNKNNNNFTYKFTSSCIGICVKPDDICEYAFKISLNLKGIVTLKVNLLPNDTNY